MKNHNTMGTPATCAYGYLRCLHLALPLLCMLGLASCVEVGHLHMNPVPLLRANDEVHIACGAYTDPDTDAGTYELDAAYAVTDHLGLMLNGAVSTEEGSCPLMEAAVGYNRTLGPNLMAECYAGFGRGDVTGTQSAISMSRAFLQPSIGYSTRNFDLAATVRLTYFKYDAPSWTGTYPVYDLYPELDGGRMLMQPGAVMRVGIRSVKLQLQYAYSFFLGRSLDLEYTDNISAGVQISLNNSFPKRTSRPKDR